MIEILTLQAREGEVSWEARSDSSSAYSKLGSNRKKTTDLPRYAFEGRSVFVLTVKVGAVRTPALTSK